MTAPRLVLEDRVQSHGQEITSHVDVLQAVEVAATRRHRPEELTVRVLGMVLASHGLSMSPGDLEHLAKQVLCAEEYAATMGVLAKAV